MYAYVAADVSEASLDCANIHEVTERKMARKFKNVRSAFEELYEWALRLADGRELVFGMEATGDYSKQLQWFLEEKGVRMHIFNPKQIRDLANGLGIEIKDDKVDSYVICQAMMMTKSQGKPYRRQFHERIRSISRRITKLTELRAKVKTRLKSPALAPEVRESLERQRKFYGGEIDILDKHWRDLVASDEQLSKNYRVAVSLNSVGHKTARVAVSEYEETTPTRTSKAYPAYAGAVPHAKSSGKKVDAKVGRGGNRFLKKALFLPAVRLLRSEGPERTLYLRLRAAGRNHDEAIIPIMHKLALRIGVVLKRGTPWSADPPKVANC